MDKLLLLKNLKNGRIWRERILRDLEDFLAHVDDWLIKPIRIPSSNAFGSMWRTVSSINKINKTIPVAYKYKYWPLWPFSAAGTSRN